VRGIEAERVGDVATLPKIQQFAFLQKTSRSLISCCWKAWPSNAAALECFAPAIEHFWPDEFSPVEQWYRLLELELPALVSHISPSTSHSAQDLRAGGNSVILLLQNNPYQKDQGPNNPEQNLQISGPFPVFHFALAFPVLQLSMVFFEALRRAKVQ